LFGVLVNRNNLICHAVLADNVTLPVALQHHNSCFKLGREFLELQQSPEQRIGPEVSQKSFPAQHMDAHAIYRNRNRLFPKNNFQFNFKRLSLEHDAYLISHRLTHISKLGSAIFSKFRQI
jgi:hypothetical protein